MGGAKQSGPTLSIGAKLTLATVVVLVAAMTLLFFQLTARERRNLLESKEKAAVAVTELFAEGMSAPLDFDDEDSGKTALHNLTGNPEVVAAFVWKAKDGSLYVSHTAGEGTAIDKPSTSAPSSLALPAGAPQVVRVVRPVLKGDEGEAKKEIGLVAVDFSLAKENAAFVESRKSLLTMSVSLAAGLILVLAAIARLQIVNPLARLTEAAKRVERGEHANVEVSSNDEIGVLGVAFNGMAGAIVDREERLATVNRSMGQLFDNMRQAIFAFGPELRVVGSHSKQAEALFGERIEGSLVFDLVFSGCPEWDDARRAFEMWSEAIFSQSASDWDEWATLAPTEVTMNPLSDDERNVTLEFRPIVEGDAIVRIMLLATDETEKRRLEAQMMAQSQEHEKQMALMKKLLAGGAQLFITFMRGAGERLDRFSEELGKEDRSLKAFEIESLFQHAHTVKGEARAFELEKLEDVCAGMENRLAELRAFAETEGAAPLGETLGALHQGISDAHVALAEVRQMFVEASPIGEAILDQTTVNRSDIDRLLAAVGDRDDIVSEIASRLASRPFGESVGRLVEGTPVWAEQLGKRATLVVEGRDVLIPPRLAKVLSGSLTHMVRNSVAHGIEAPDAREAAGKEAIGIVRLTGEQVGKGVVIALQDDGAGLNIAALRRKAESLGLDVKPGREWELIFASGVSTTEVADDISGRGVGMAAVKGDIEAAGYMLDVQTEAGKGTTFIIRSAAS
jgi:two-component system, chemotaxis family, sensor kinase CheA